MASSEITFAVFGDNRGDSEGEQSPVFVAMVRAINEAAPQLVLNLGDMINGYAGEDEAHLRRLWRGYQREASELKAPVRHVPGNHDVFDDLSARLWRELWGPTYYAFEQGGVLFIALDTETEVNRLGEVQRAWLERQLDEAGGRPVFVFMHRPLFPVNGHRGLSLDVYPQERDWLHGLFVSHGTRIRGVFQGHEHLYHFEERDGVPYYILGGGGEELYVPPELGGFFHFLLVRVEDGTVRTDVRRVGEQAQPQRAVAVIKPDTLLEEWRSPLFWYTWGPSVSKQLWHGSDGRGLKVWFDFAQCQWPVLLAPLHPRQDWRCVEQVCVDVHVQDGLSGLTLGLELVSDRSYVAPTAALAPGWNVVVVRLDESWLPAEARRAVRELEWHLTSARGPCAGWVVFHHVRTTPAVLEERWDNEHLWGAYDETVRQAAAPATHFPIGSGLQVSYDLARFARPILYAALDPIWDLRGTRQLLLDVFQPPTSPAGLQLTLALSARNVRSRAPAVSLVNGWNTVAIDLEASWLPASTRAAAEQIEWELSSAGEQAAGWLLLGNLRSG